MTSPTIPTAWADALAVIQRAFPSAIIAGGALRDLAFGLQPKDTDIFVSAHEGDVMTLGDIVRPLGWMEAGLTLTDEYANTMRGEVRALETWSVPGLDFPVQVIPLRFEPEGFAHSAVSRMDIGACQVAWDGRQFTFTPAYGYDLKLRHFTVVNYEDVKQAMRTAKCITRFRERNAHRYPLIHYDTRMLDAVFDQGSPVMTAAAEARHDLHAFSL